MKIIINAEYEYLRSFIEQIVVIFENEGKLIYSRRNQIKVFDAGDLVVNVKRYGVPSLFNRIIYSYFRPSKGFRAFTYPQMLLAKGFQTPHPVAYVEEESFGLIEHSYFVSIQCPYKRKFYEFGDADIEECRDVVKAFARYTARLHEAGILHRDYSPGNILFDKIDGEYQFSLVDINRMSFGAVDIRNGCANFARLWGQIPFFEYLAKEYASARGANEEECIRLVLAYRKKFWKKFRMKHGVEFELHL